MVWARERPPVALLEGLRRRGVEPRVTHDAFRTMAEVVAGGSMELTGAILVLVEPADLRGKRAMLTSCRRYASGLRIWVYQAAAPIQLRPLELTQLVPEPEDEPEHTFGPEPGLGDPGSSRMGGVPSLRLVEPVEPETQMPVNERPGDTDNQADHRPSGLLTDEELAMLLADDPPERKKR